MPPQSIWLIEAGIRSIAGICRLEPTKFFFYREKRVFLLASHRDDRPIQNLEKLKDRFVRSAWDFRVLRWLRRWEGGRR